MNSGNDQRHAGLPDTITVLRCRPGFFAGKTHTRERNGSNTTIGHRAGKFFTIREISVASIFELHAALEELGLRQDELVIRGAENPSAEISEGTLVRRASRIDPKLGEEVPWFIEQPRRWVLLDFDGIPNPGGIDPTSPAAMAYLRTLLPEEFQDVTCSYSFSSSVGLRDDDSIRGHLWFFLDRAVGSKELKCWLAPTQVDKSLFNTVQPHFVANPRFEKGRKDPIAKRKGILAGKADVVEVPEIDVSVRHEQLNPGSSDGLKTAIGYEARISKLGDGPGGEGCHGVITPAIAAYLAQHGPGADRSALKEDIRARATQAYWDRSKHPADYVEKEISDAVLDRSIQDWIEKAFVIEEAYPEVPKLPLDQARRKLADAVASWIRDAGRWHGQGDYRKALLEGRLRVIRDGSGGLRLDFDGPPSTSWPMYSPKSIRTLFPPPRHAIAAQVGLGKTRAIVERLPDLVAASKPGHCVLVTVPNHELSREMAERIQAAGLSVEIYLGPTQPDPGSPGSQMCRRHEDFEVFKAAGMGNELCAVCADRNVCGYLRQRSKTADVWIAAHNILYHPRRRPVPPVDFVVVDEDPVGAGYDGGDDGWGKYLKPDDVPQDVGKAIRMLPLGEPLERKDFGLTDQRLRDLTLESYRGLIDVELPDAPTDEQIETLRKILQRNLSEIGKAKLYEEIRLHGPFGMRALRDEDHGVVLSWKRQRRLHRDFDVPMLILDATLRRDVVRHLVDTEQPPVGYRAQSFVDEDGSIAFDDEYPMEPIVGPVTEIAAETPDVGFRQVLFSAAASRFGDDRQGRANVGKIRRYVEARSAFVESVLVICQKSLEAELVELGLPGNVQIAHFNAIRGKDIWRDVERLVVIGRTQAPPNAVETHAEALFRASVGALGGDYYGHVWKPLSGQDRLVRVERHFDPLVELIRWGICEAELIQAIGRGRPVNRTSASPLEIDMVNFVPLPDVVVDESVEWSEAQPSPLDVVAGRFGLLLPRTMVPGMARVLAGLLPDLFTSENAARQAGVSSRADPSDETLHSGASAREYEGAEITFDLVYLKAEGSRYSVPALALLDSTRKPRIDFGGLSPLGIRIGEELPRKWREKLRMNEDIASVFGLRISSKGNFRVWR